MGCGSGLVEPEVEIVTGTQLSWADRSLHSICFEMKSSPLLSLNQN